MTDALNPIPIPDVRKGQGDVTLSREEFARRLGEQFADLDSRRCTTDHRVVTVEWV